MRRATFAGAWLAVLAIAAGARAEDTSELEGLLNEPVVQSASKTAQTTASVAPATTTTITAEDLRRHGIHSLDEALNFLSLGMITENPRETVEIGARGVLLTGDYGNHVLLLVDGHAMNEQWDGTAYYDRGAAIPFELIDHIEVILGPGSVLYGSNAMLGVIDVVTKRAKDFGGLRGVFESELPTSIRGALGFGREFRLLGKASEVTAAIEYFGSKGPSANFGPQNYGADKFTKMPARFNSATPADGIWSSQGVRNQFFSQAPSAYVRFIVGDFELSLRGAMWKRWGPGIYTADLGDTSGYELDRWLSIDARYRATLSPIAQLSARLYGDIYDYHEHDPIALAEQCLEGQTRGCVYDLDGKARWAGAEIRSTFDWLRNGRFTTLIGLEGRLKYTQGSTGEYVDAVTMQSAGTAPDYSHTRKALAAFLELTGRPTSWLDLNAGARLDTDESFGSHVSPRLAATASPWHGGHLKSIYAEAFRAPTAYERDYYDPKAQLAAPDLRPETVRSVEGSFEQRLGAQRLLVSVFRTWWNDLVVLGSASPSAINAAHDNGQLAKDVSSASQYMNASSVENYGVNLACDGVLLAQRLRYGLGVTGAYARQNPGDGTPVIALPAAAQLFGNARLSYDLGGKLPVLALVGRFADSRPIAGASFTPTAYSGPLVELRGTVSGPFPRVPGLSYRVSANGVVSQGNPYAIGPLREPHPGFTKPETMPVDRFRTTVGLEYVLPL